MQRAAVLIGVDKTGNLPKLQDAARCANRMADWARQQGVNTVELITDEQEDVAMGDIRKAIERILQAGTDQLVVYFAGHGVNIRYGEYWLLSGAPRTETEAVNLRESEVLARFCGIPHVVFISDACRTAADGIQAQNVRGSSLFPNDLPDGREQPVDQFFACTLGRPAHEIRDPAVTTGEYTALYTQVLLDALKGRQRDKLEWEEPGHQKAFLRPRPLKDYLEKAVTASIRDRNLQTKVIQIPDARITSDKNAWLALFSPQDLPGIAAAEEAPPTPPALESEPPTIGPRTLGPPRMGIPTSLPGEGGGGGLRQPRRRAARSTGTGGSTRAAAVTTPATVSTSLVRSALGEQPMSLGDALTHARGSEISAVKEMADSAELLAQPFGPTHHETLCGIKIRGALIQEVFTKRIRTEIIGNRDDVRVFPQGYESTSALVVLDQGLGILVPVLSEYLVALTIEDGELVDLSYEPSEHTWRWDDYNARAAEIRSLRAVAASAVTRGVFRLDGDDALAVARKMQYAKAIDPTLAVYAAYGYHDLQRPDLIREMSGYMRNGIGAPLFDVALLAGELTGKLIGEPNQTHSPIPLLAQGWAYLSAYRVELPQSLKKLQQTLVPSVWSMFNPTGVEQLKTALQFGDIR